MSRPLGDVLDQVEWFEDDEQLQVSAEGTLLIAEFVCAPDGVGVSDYLLAANDGSRSVRRVSTAVGESLVKLAAVASNSGRPGPGITHSRYR